MYTYACSLCVCMCVWPSIEHSAKHSALSVRNALLFYYRFYFIILSYTNLKSICIQVVIKHEDRIEYVLFYVKAGSLF